uniref:Variant surface glycoprotein 1125.1308 n=1 Tax=Trypanosoma brucei TaxID=5691 RepID=A0A1J0R6M1_9TRYP|nr:variant surface glycoprotein 1125.1308 [Trypanosoma brucei]
MIASLIIALLFASAVDAAAPDEGSNSGDFAVLCEVINLARTSPAQIAAPGTEDDILKMAALINLTLNSPETLELLVKAENKDTAVKDTASSLGKACSEIGHEICLKAGKRYNENKNLDLYKQWANLRQTDQAKKTVVHLADSIKALHAKLAHQLQEADTRAATADLATALGPKPDNKEELKLGSSGQNRETLCGPDASTKGLAARKSLAADAICLCAKDTTQTTDNVCSKAVQLTRTDFANGGSDVKEQWQKIAEACTAQASGNPTTSTTIRAALTAFKQTIAVGKGSDAKLTNYLGLVDGTGNSGCAGEKDSNKETCVFYGTNKEDHSLDSIPWARKMASAANKLETAQKAAEEAFRLHTQLLTLNNSLTAVVFTPETQNQKKLKPDADTKTTETNKKECEAIQKQKNEKQWKLQMGEYR